MNRIFFLIVFIAVTAFSQSIKILKVEPPNWWIGMKLNKVQLMVYGENLSDITANFSSSDIKITKIHKIDNSSYAFIDIKIPDNINSGEYTLTLSRGSESAQIKYPIYKREILPDEHNGFNQEDVIYLITPDRFANGDLSNDNVEGLTDKRDKDNPRGRHGGDLQGIIEKLDYLKDLGITAIWINPIIENNGRMSYHGYAATDLYKIDPRFGTNELYRELVNEAHKRNIKIIFDHVANHIGINHHWMNNPPTEDWTNGGREDHFITNHNKVSLMDINADSTTKVKNVDGWFVESMPDLNQKNPFVANYLIQNMIWWIEYTGLDGIREDTYPYPDQRFMSEWNKAIMDEYPNFNIVGEVWIDDPIFLSYYQRGSILNKEFDSNLPALTDFGISAAYTKYLKEGNLYAVYNTFAKDFIYPDPENLVTFLDNHDYQRALFTSNGDMERVKSALQLLLTTRGIPQILYGTEIGMKGTADHGSIRTDFPGGFPEHQRNAFNSAQRTDAENDIYNYLQKLLQIRKENTAIAKGKLIHYPPDGNIYVYLKILENDKYLLLVNENKEDKIVDLNRCSKYLNIQNTLLDLFTGEEVSLANGLMLEVSKGGRIYKIQD